MKYKILASVLGLGALGYIFRDRIIAAGVTLMEKVDAFLDDPTVEEDAPSGPPYTGYNVGKRGPVETD